MIKTKPVYANWMNTAEQFDRHFGHDAATSNLCGPCSQSTLYLVEAHDDAHLATAAVESVFAAWRMIVSNTSSDQFSRHENAQADREFVLWMAAIKSMDDAWMDKHYRYLTEEMRFMYLTAHFTRVTESLPVGAASRHYNDLLYQSERHRPSLKSWAALQIGLRIYEDALVHLAYHHRPTRMIIEKPIQGAKNVAKRKELYAQAKIHSRTMHDHCMKILHDDSAPTSPRSPRPGPKLSVIMGGKRL